MRQELDIGEIDPKAQILRILDNTTDANDRRSRGKTGTATSTKLSIDQT